MVDFNTDTEAGVIADLAKRATAMAPAIVSAPGGRSYLITSEDVKVQDVTPKNAGTTSRPDHISQTITLQTTKSLGDYLAKYKADDTTLFADITHSRIVGAIDYHAPRKADLVIHTATLDLPFSNEWKLWTSIDGKHLSQLDFARWLEEHRDDITEPSAADLLEIVRDLHAVNTENTKAVVRTNTDHVDFEFTATQDARGASGGKLDIPKTFELHIPVYFGEPSVPIEARLRWNKSPEGGVLFGVMLMNKEQVRQDDFMRVVGMVAETSGLPALYGRIGS